MDDFFVPPTPTNGKSSTSTPKNMTAKKLAFTSDFVDDDDLMQAIALSLQDSAGFLDVKTNCLQQTSGANLRDNSTSIASGTIFIDSSDRKMKISTFRMILARGREKTNGC